MKTSDPLLMGYILKYKGNLLKKPAFFCTCLLILEFILLLSWLSNNYFLIFLLEGLVYFVRNHFVAPNVLILYGNIQ